jgi:hypothetical protein
MQTTQTEISTARRTALFARIALAGIALYVALDVVAQLLPPHYNPIRQAESDLAVGPYGYVMAINFVVRGVLTFALLLALRAGLPTQTRSRAGGALLAIWAIGALILAVSPTDLTGRPPTLHGLIHLVVAVNAFIAGAVGELLISLRLGADPRLHGVAQLATVIAIGACTMLIVGLLTARADVFGLTERIFIGVILLWMGVVAWRLQVVGHSQGQAH